ncbi:hypothetical protein C8Q77DRAFT_1161035 [Trametes polyzona]|nr:hypothetical protein C8Q77DRAFT_1161035 [Trametes polyzona]
MPGHPPSPSRVPTAPVSSHSLCIPEGQSPLDSLQISITIPPPRAAQGVGSSSTSTERASSVSAAHQESAIPRTEPVSLVHREVIPVPVTESLPLPPSAPQLNRAAAARAQVSATVDALFASRDIEDAKLAFDDLPARHHGRLIDALVSSAAESANQCDADLVTSLFRRVASDGLCSAASWEAGFALTAGTLRDVVVEEPRALGRFMSMFRAARLDRDGERAARVLLRLGDGLN